jgi:hypothetical protein
MFDFSNKLTLNNYASESEYQVPLSLACVASVIFIFNNMKGRLADDFIYTIYMFPPFKHALRLYKKSRALDFELSFIK